MIPATRIRGRAFLRQPEEGIEEMLTFKHVMGGKEFAREIGCYTIDRNGKRITIQAYEGDEDSASLGIWGGYRFRDELPENIAVVEGHIYIMNSAGSTVADAVYYAAATSLVETQKPVSFPEEQLEAA
ncbi:MAG: hypothetical protein ACPG6T_03915 [Paracoccaceae bacterium]